MALSAAASGALVLAMLLRKGGGSGAPGTLLSGTTLLSGLFWRRWRQLSAARSGVGDAGRPELLLAANGGGSEDSTLRRMDSNSAGSFITNASKRSAGGASGTFLVASDRASSSQSLTSDSGNDHASPPTPSSDEPAVLTSSQTLSEDEPSETAGGSSANRSVVLPPVLSTPGMLDLVALEDLRRAAAEERGPRSSGGGGSSVVHRAPHVHNMQSTTKMMARQLGYRMPPDLPADCCWMEMPALEFESHGADAPSSGAAQPTLLFPGVLGGPALFDELVPRLRGQRGGTIAITYSTELMLGCETWQELILRYTELVRQVISPSSASLRIVAYSFGCRIAYAVASLLEVERWKVQLVLIDGPIGGVRGSFEQALLELHTPRRSLSTARSPVAAPVALNEGGDEMAVATQLLTLLSHGGEEPAEPLGRRARVELFIASEDDVGVEMARDHLPQVHVHRVCGGHRDILVGRSASEVGKLISDAWTLKRRESRDEIA
jgi:hypothetical protein